MVKYETTEEILASFFDPEKRAKFYLYAYRVEVNQLEKTIEKIQKDAKDALSEAEKQLLKERKRVELSIILLLNQGIKLGTISTLFNLSKDEVLAFQEKYEGINHVNEEF
jgi:hypothetical protein